MGLTVYMGNFSKTVQLGWHTHCPYYLIYAITLKYAGGMEVGTRGADL